MDISDLAPAIAKLIGVQPSTLVLLIMVITTLAKVLSRRIPDNATGILGTIRQISAVIGIDVSNKLTKDATVNDVAKAALETPPIPAKVAADKTADAQPQP